MWFIVDLSNYLFSSYYVRATSGPSIPRSKCLCYQPAVQVHRSAVYHCINHSKECPVSPSVNIQNAKTMLICVQEEKNRKSSLCSLIPTIHHLSYTRSHKGLLFLLCPEPITFLRGHSVFEFFRGGDGSGYLSRLLFPPYKPSSRSR